MNPVSVLPAPADLAGLSNDEVEAGLRTWAGRVAAGEARLLAYIGEFDERHGWAMDGILSCAHWLSWRLGMGQNAAGERVRVARALRRLPGMFAAFAAGRLSYTQVRAISRVATAEDERKWIDYARHATGRQLELLIGGVRRATANLKRRKAADTAAAAGKEPDIERIRVFTRYDDDNGDLSITIKASAADGAILLAAIDAARTDLDATPDLSAERADSADGSDIPQMATRGDGLLHLTAAYLDHRAVAHPDRARRDRSQLVVNIDPISGWARLPDGEFLPPGSLPIATLPAGAVLRPIRPADLTAHDAGRSQRHPSQPLRDLIGTLDGERCRYPSCTRRRKLHAHHVIEWQHGGRTDLANMILLCSRHHTVVHAEGFQLILHPHSRALTIYTAAGKPVPHKHVWPWQPADHLDPDSHIDAATLPPRYQGPFDLHYAVDVLMQHAA